MLNIIRNSRVVKAIMTLIVLQIVFEVLISQLLYASLNTLDYKVEAAPAFRSPDLKSDKPFGLMPVPSIPKVMPQPLPNGPDQPESSGPSGVISDNMVDPFTGDFSYSVPLFEVGNIPVSLNYSAGVGMDQEASWVGLGWSLNPGAINRQVRGLPDDFKNDQLIEEINIRPNRTYGVTVQYGSELIGLDTLGLGVSLTAVYNNYTGFDISTTLSTAIPAGECGSIGLTLSSESKDNFGDLGISPQVNFGAILRKTKIMEEPKFDFTLSPSFSSSRGLEAITIKRAENYYEPDAVSGATVHRSTNAGFASLNVSNFMNDLTVTPKQNYSFENYAFTFNAAFGADFLILEGDIKLKGFYSQQKLKEDSIVTPTQGYLYLENGVSDVLMDFNRESDGPIEETNPNLSPSYLTPDLYVVSSPGMSGVFRAYRDEIGYIEENNIVSPSTSVSGGLELAIGNLTSPGVDIAAVEAFTTSAEWKSLNAVDDRLKYTGNNTPNEILEKVHFAMMGETGAERDPEFIEAIGGANPIEFNTRDLVATASLQDLINTHSDSYPVFPIEDELEGSLDDAAKKRDQRTSRTIDISYLTRQELRQFEVIPKYKICDLAKDHHVSEIVITNTDGTQYIYGLPVYNTSSYEVTFNVGKKLDGTGSITTYDGIRVLYDSVQASLANERGIDQYFSRRYTPAYVSSYLLTEILSSDYVDVTGDGPSADDLGNYVEYTYGVLNEETGLYEADISELNWRTPNDESTFRANFWEGFESIDTDDKANFMYGTKEVWYLSAIESKEYAAEFHHSATDRKDGYEPLGMDGGINEAGGNVLHQLDSIQLFTTMDLLWAEELSADPTPEKTIKFHYNHQLCDNYVLNQSGITGEGGKLTLIEVSFRYKNSNKSKYSRYTFDYHHSDEEENPDYDFSEVDRWGNYKPDPGYGELPNWRHPYVDQADPDLDFYAGAWCLKEIVTPENARIIIEYEADDYAYVQNKPAAQLIEILSVESDPGLFNPVTPKNYLYSFLDFGTIGKLDNYDVLSTYNYLIFKLVEDIDGGIDPSDANTLIKKGYLLADGRSKTDKFSIPQNLYFKFKLNMNEVAEEDYDFEYVSGYCDLDVEESDWAGAFKSSGSTDYDYGYIRVKPEPIKLRDESNDNQDENDFEFSINPISKAGFQHTMENFKHNILNENAPGELGEEGIIEYLGDVLLVTALLRFYQKPNSVMCSRAFCSKFDPGNAWVRMQVPTGYKYGGGYRVRKITIEDNWDEMTDSGVALEVVENEASYTVEYIYTTENEEGNLISSGVAAYEPSMGGDENPLKLPIEYNFKEDNLYRYKRYKEYPFGETFYPAPQIGYSKVTILTNDNSYHRRTGVGRVVNEYYTLRDRPTKATWTMLSPITYKSGLLSSLFSNTSITSYTGSQGYAFETSDIHGKLKSVSAYPERSDVPIVQTVYHYKDDNLVTTIDKQGHFHENSEIGTTYDLTVDMRTNVNQSIGVTLRASLDIFTVGIPISIFTIPAMLDYSRNESNLAVVTKVINHSVVLEYVEQIDNGSKVSTKNVYYDHYTGQPIVTTIQNEFNDEYYSVNYPAHWMYQGMDFSAINSRYMFTSAATDDNLNWATGKLTSSVTPYLNPGDRIGIRSVIHYDGGFPGFGISEIYGYQTELCWVYEETDAGCTGGPCYYLIDRDGNVPDFDALAASFDGGGLATELQFIVLNSGSRNLHSESVGSTVMKEDPMIVGFDAFDENASIITSSANTYSDRWQKFCVPKEVSSVGICLCDEEVPIAAQQFFNVLESLFETSVRFSSSPTGIEIDDEILYETSPIETYFHDMTTMLKDIFVSYSPPSSFTQVAQGRPISTSQMELLIKNNPGVDTCEYNIFFYSDEEMTTTFSFTDDADVEDIFGAPDEMSFEFYVAPESDTSCNDVTGFIVHIDYLNGAGTPSSVWAKVLSSTECITFRNCQEKIFSNAYCTGDTGQIVNPYVQGLLGIWRPNISYAYLVNRTPGAYASVDPELRFDGTYDTYTPFWERAGSDTYWQENITDLGWTWAQKVEVMDAKIGQIETVNALDVYGAATYGFNQRTAEMVVENARYQYVGFESFEDNTYHEDILKMDCLNDHFKLANSIDDLSTERAHTGYFSMKIGAEETYTYTIPLMDAPPEYPRIEYPETFIIELEDCVPHFAPESNAEEDKTYILSLWVYQAFNNANPIYSYEGDVTIDVLIGSTPASISPDVVFGPLIDGWQRVDAVFTIVDGSTGDFQLKILNGSSTDIIYVDDVRIMPYDARANCYVYDYKSYRLLSELDANHFSTFYDYDEEGRLTRVRKETENGIMTISENRYSTVKREF